MIRPLGLRAFLTTICAVLSFLTCLANGYKQVNVTSTPGYKLLRGIRSVPAPVSVDPDEGWMGIDGSWSTFGLRQGASQDKIQVFASTASQQIWAVHPQACLVNKTDPNTKQIVEYNVINSDCEISRGHLFNVTQSKTWHRKGYFQLWLEKKLGFVGNGLFGFDSVHLGWSGDDKPTVPDTTIGTLVAPNFWLGHIGLHPKPTNFSDKEEPVPSYLVNLFTQKNIPSLSFGYTAGAKYREFSHVISLPAY